MPPLQDHRLPRGVYKAPYLVNGFEALLAVDRNGVARKHLKLTQLMNEERATRWLELWLDRVDPPTLRAAGEVTTSPTTATWPYDHEALPPRPDRSRQLMLIRPMPLY